MSGLTEELTLILRKSGSQILYDECVFPGKCQIPSVQVQIHDKHDYGSEMSQCFAPSDLFRRWADNSAPAVVLYGSGPLAKYVLALGDLRWAWVIGEYSLFVELLAPQAACMLEGSFRVLRLLVYSGAFLKNRLIHKDEWIAHLTSWGHFCMCSCTCIWESVFGKGRISSGYHNKTPQWLQQQTFPSYSCRVWKSEMRLPAWSPSW